jgi:protease I
MTTNAALHGKRIIFCLAEGFIHEQFDQLLDYFRAEDATTLVAGYDKDVELTSGDGSRMLITDVSYAYLDRNRDSYDAIIIADGVTGRAIRDNPAAMNLVHACLETNAAVIAVGMGVQPLIDAEAANGKVVTVPQELRDQFKLAGAFVVDEAVVVSDNLFTARADADMRRLCNMVIDYLVNRRRHAA